MNNLPKYFKKISIVALVLILVGTAGAVVVGHSERGVQMTQEETVDVTDVNHITIRTSNQRIRIQQTTEDQARVVSNGMPSNAVLRVEVLGDTLDIDVSIPRRNISFGFNLADLRSAMQGPALTVYLPEQAYESIQAVTSNGRIDVENIVAVELLARTSNGRIDVAGVEAETISLETTNSRIEISDVTGDVWARTTNGQIGFYGDTITHNVELITTNGRIEVGLSQTPEHADFSLSTTNSRTRLFGEDRTHQTFGDGTYEVRLQTTNGRIEVEVQ